MVKKLSMKVFVLMMLTLSIALGSHVQAESLTSISDGTYTVGVELNPGLTKFSISQGNADFMISRGNQVLLYETIESDNYYYSNEFSMNLQAGDEVEVVLDYDSSAIDVTPLSSVDLKNVRAGFYEIGTDIPVGTYTVKFDKPMDDYDIAYVEILDKNLHVKKYYDLFSDDGPFDYTFSKGDYVYISVQGSMNFTEKILIPQSITVSKSSLSLMMGRTAQVTATVNPSTVSNKSVSWTSSNPVIATVDSKGTIKAVKVGSTTITATAKGAPSVKKDIKVTVMKVVPTSIKLSKSTVNITKNQSLKVTATVSPTDATNKTVVWKSSNPKVATVDSKGTIKGISNGSATITATAKDNSKVSKTVAVKVSTKTLKLDKTSLSVTKGKTATLKATVSPFDSTDKTVGFKSSNKKIATVDSKGKVTGVATGTATITATVKGAKEGKVKVTVTAPVAAKSVKLNKTSATVSKGKTVTLSATVSPSNTTNKTVKWKSSNTKVATVDSKGKVTAVGAGTAKITATTSNGKVATATINVPYVKSLSTGMWKAGKDLPEGRYKITTKSGFGNLFIGEGTDRFVNEILTSDPYDDFGVTTVTTDIKAGDKIEIMGINSVQFTRVTNVKSTTLHSGYWTVGKDINAARYKVTTTNGFGNFIVYRGKSLLVNEILSSEPDYYAVTSVTTTLKSGDRIYISGLNNVKFTKK